MVPSNLRETSDQKITIKIKCLEFKIGRVYLMPKTPTPKFSEVPYLGVPLAPWVASYQNIA
jgi:hypothetical protein